MATFIILIIFRMSGAQSLSRQNYSAEVEAAVNKQINAEFCSSYVYLSMVGWKRS